MRSFTNKTNKKIRIDSRTYLEPGETKEIDEKNPVAKAYIAMRYLVEATVTTERKPFVAVHIPDVVKHEEENAPSDESKDEDIVTDENHVSFVPIRKKRAKKTEE